MVLTWLFRRLPFDWRKQISSNPIEALKKYSQLINTVNKTVIKRVIEGERIKLGQLGVLHIEARENHFKRKVLDTKATLERRKFLIANGITPYKAIRDKDGKIIGDNGGEKYYVYRSDDWYVGFQIGTSRMIYVPSTDSNDKGEPIKYRFLTGAIAKKALYHAMQANPNLKHRYENLRNLKGSN